MFVRIWVPQPICMAETVKHVIGETLDGTGCLGNIQIVEIQDDGFEKQVEIDG